MSGRTGSALRSLLVIYVATTGCSIQNRAKVQYSGQLTSTSTACPKTHGTLVIQAGDVVFTPNDSTWTLDGKAIGSSVQASRSRPSFDHKLFATELKATMTEGRAIGTYSTPTCTYAVDLARI